MHSPGESLEELAPGKQSFSILAVHSNHLRGPGHIPDQLNQNAESGTQVSVIFFRKT